jgi:hypothetical protein
MNRTEFIADIEASYAKGVEIIKLKNRDYGANDNPFKNFQSASVIGLGLEAAILVRTLDKMSRIGNLLKQEAAVKDESVEDTLLDAINYLAILLAYRHSLKPQTETRPEEVEVELDPE